MFCGTFTVMLTETKGYDRLTTDKRCSEIKACLLSVAFLYRQSLQLARDLHGAVLSVKCTAHLPTNQTARWLTEV